MKITWTSTAKEHLLAALHEQSNAIGIHVAIKKMGCSGYGYVVDIVDIEPQNATSMPFVENFKVFISNKDIPILDGINIDYIKHGVNSKLVFNNPNQKGQCGCGESFTV
jgi:iron-sulfur cluster assembly protein